MKFGCCAPIRYYYVIKETGFDFIECSGREIAALTEEEFRQWEMVINRGGIPCLAINDYCSEELVIAGPGFDIGKTREYAELICERGSRLGVKLIGVGAPASRKLPEGFDRELAEKQAQAFVTETCTIAQKYGITVMWEACNKCVTNFHTKIHEVVAFVEDLNIDNLKLVIDFYHLSAEGEELTVIEDALPYTVHLHVAMGDDKGRKNFLTGDGYSYHKEIISTINAHGYDGTISIEPHPHITEREITENGLKSLNMLRSIEREVKNGIS